MGKWVTNIIVLLHVVVCAFSNHSLLSLFCQCSLLVGQIWKVCISSDDQWAVALVFPETIQVWSLKTGEPVLSIPGPYTDIVITQDSSQIVAAQGHHLEVGINPLYHTLYGYLSDTQGEGVQIYFISL